MREKGVIVVGSTTIDKIVQSDASFFKLGGVTTYAGITFKRHGIDTMIVSNVAPQDGYSLRRLHQEGIRVCNGHTKHTTLFINYTNGDKRRQALPLTANSIQYHQIVDVLNSASLLHLGPLYPTDIPIETIQQLHDPELFISLDLQGYVRYRKHHIVYPVVSEYLPDALNVSKIVKATQEELNLVLNCYNMSLPELMACYAIQEFVVTLGSQGGIVRNVNGDEIHYDAEPITTSVDSTGAGDVFFATYLVNRFFKAQNMGAATKSAAEVAVRQIEGNYLTLRQLALPLPSTMYAFDNFHQKGGIQSMSDNNTKCLIIAAGQGKRLRHKTDSKPLLPLLGVPLIERVIRSAKEAGAEDFYVVIGSQGEKVSSFLESLSRRLDIPMTIIFNEDWNSSENGVSILKACDHFTEPFLLLMSDHVLDSALIHELLSEPLDSGEIALAVDADINNPLVDMEDVTRVRRESGRIQNIGKGLEDFNGLDTGVFHCTPAIFDALDKSFRRGNTSLSAAVRRLAAQNRAKTVDVSGKFWIDVDDQASFERAEQAMLDRLRAKPNDGPVSRYLNRPLSIRISRLLVRYPVSPNQISLFSFVCSVMAAGLFALGGYFALVLGGILAQFASIIDGCDGEVARLTYQSSDYGGWFDAVLDRYADAFLLFGLTWHLYATGRDRFVLLVGFMAIIGSFMLSYTADKYDKLMRERIKSGRFAGVRVGRDVRVFLIFLAALTHQILLALAIIAIIMNLETVRRVVICRNNG